MEENIVTTTTVTTTKKEDAIVDSDNNNTPTEDPKPFMGGMLEDNSGGTSLMRVFMMLGGMFILSIFGFAVVWCVLHGLPIPDIPLQWSIAFSSLIAGKVGQKYFESKT